MDENLKKEIQSATLERLMSHLHERKDVQNIDLMNLGGFCRNCLSKWYAKYANELEYDLDYEESRKIIYGMPYSEWKEKYQTEATNDQLNKFNEKE